MSWLKVGGMYWGLVVLDSVVVLLFFGLLEDVNGFGFSSSWEIGLMIFCNSSSSCVGSGVYIAGNLSYVGSKILFK